MNSVEPEPDDYTIDQSVVLQVQEMVNCDVPVNEIAQFLLNAGVPHPRVVQLLVEGLGLEVGAVTKAVLDL